MSSNSPDFLEFLRELMADVPGLRMRAMFGGHGVYSSDLIFALVDNDVLYIKTDDENRNAFLAAGSTPFTIVMKGEERSMAYFSVPEEALEEPGEMMRWARLGMDAALRKATRS